LVGPMQIVEEEYQGMFRLGECANEAPEGELEQSASLLRRKIRSGRWLADDRLELGDELDHEPSVRPKRLVQRGAPTFQLRLALGHEAPDQCLEGLGDRSVGNVALMLIELARREKTARWHEGLVQLIDDGGFADTRIAGHQHQLRPAGLDDAVEGGEQGLDFAR